MRAIIQRTNQASIAVDSKIVAEIPFGLLVLVGISKDDTEAGADYLAQRIPRMRVFEDSEGKMNRDLIDVQGSLLVVPNFTVYGDCRKGRRPGFDLAAKPETARPLFEYLVTKFRASGVTVQTGIFQAHMDVRLENSGPVTFVIDSP
jgi:D-tyrosyl-tRNA(Tyr) deacylase